MSFPYGQGRENARTETIKISFYDETVNEHRPKNSFRTTMQKFGELAGGTVIHCEIFIPKCKGTICVDEECGGPLCEDARHAREPYEFPGGWVRALKTQGVTVQNRRYMDTNVYVLSRKVTPAVHEKMARYAYAQIGKPFNDWDMYRAGLPTNFMGLDLRKRFCANTTGQSWFCSQLTAKLLTFDGLYTGIELGTVRPQDISDDIIRHIEHCRTHTNPKTGLPLKPEWECTGHDQKIIDAKMARKHSRR